MPKNCNCAGASCGCAVTGGPGVRVSGTGSAADPYVVGINASELDIAATIATATSGSVELSRAGSGSVGDPVTLVADVVVRSPNGTRWGLAVDNAGNLSTVAAAAPRRNVGLPGTIVTAGTDVVYWDGTSWGDRTAPHAIYISLGFQGVDVPSDFVKGDTWLREAT